MTRQHRANSDIPTQSQIIEIYKIEKIVFADIVREIGDKIKLSKNRLQ